MKNFIPRIPQKEAFKAFFDYYKNGGKGNPIICMFTGLGKSYALAMIIIEMLRQKPDVKIAVVTHSTKVLMQDYNALYDLLCYYNVFASLGIYSAKLNEKEVDGQITFATINSIYKNVELFDIDYCFVDEAHLVSDKEDTMYRKMITAFGTKVCGLTATPFRMKRGYIHEMEGAIFTDLIYDTNTPEKFAEMIELGYLVKPIRKPVPIEMDTKGVTKTGGDFNLKDMSIRFDRDALTQKICEDMLKYKEERKHWFVLCIDQQHSENVSAILNKLGIASDFVHSNKSDISNDEAIERFKKGEIQAVCSVMMLTTGFDIPFIDMVAWLRPTDSIVIFIQGTGRGIRAFPGLKDCLVLDYAGNTARNGPIDDPIIKVSRKGKKGGEIVKICPKCELKHHISVKVCECGHEFQFREKLQTESSEHSLIKEKIKTWLKVDSVDYYIHKKIGKPESLRIEYLCGLRAFSLWITPFHGAKAAWNSKHIFNRLKTKEIKFKKIKDIIDQKDTLRVPKKILVDVAEKYPFIEDFKFK